MKSDWLIWSLIYENKFTLSKEYIKIIKSHLPDPVPGDMDTEEIIKLFMQLSTSEDPSYSNDKEGFEKFANDYFETDIFNGEDLYWLYNILSCEIVIWMKCIMKCFG